MLYRGHHVRALVIATEEPPEEEQPQKEQEERPFASDSAAEVADPVPNGLGGALVPRVFQLSGDQSTLLQSEPTGFRLLSLKNMVNFGAGRFSA
jgi:hypothetical protein